MSDTPSGSEPKPTTKIARAAKAAKGAKARIGKAASKVTGKQVAAGAAIGIGSAAIVAALLYANRSKKG